MADARKLQRRLPERPIEFSEDVQEEEVPLIKLDCAMWTARPFCEVEAEGSGCNVQFYSPEIEQPDTEEEFDQVVERATEEPCFIASGSPASAKGQRRVS
jgi:hypothetical protein